MKNTFKNKKLLIGTVSVILVAAITLCGVLIAKNGRKERPVSETESPTSNTVSDNTLNIGEIEQAENSGDKSDDDGNFIEPDESEADKLLAEKDKKTESKAETVPTQKPAEPKPINRPANPEPPTAPVESKPQATSDNEEKKSFNEGKIELENNADNYLKTHNIDKKTAGETGEICSRCGKKIWNPDKYGFFIPGMPEDYENSGYCLGTCGISIN